jgi:hypothetical protein
MPRPDRFTSGKETRYPLYRRLGGPQGSWGKYRPPSGIRPPDSPARTEWLYRLNYPGPHFLRISNPVHESPPPPQGRKIRGSPSLVDQSTRLKCEKVAQTRAACLVSLHQSCTWTTNRRRELFSPQNISDR